MRICQIVDGLLTDASGAAAVGAFHLIERIPEPCLVMTRSAEVGLTLPPHVRLFPLPLRDSTTPPALRRRIFGGPGASPLSRVRLQGALAARALRHHTRALLVALREMQRFPVDLVVCHQLQWLLYGVAAKRALGCKLVVYVRGAAELEALPRLPLLGMLLRVADRVVAVSPEIARRLRGLVRPDRIWLTSTGVDTATFRDWGRRRTPQLVTIAHFKWMKGYPDLLEAMARVFPRLPHHRLILVGDGEERPRIVELIERLRLADRVVLTGVLPGAEVVRILNESSLFVLASVHEGLPRALLEAIACGTPAVVTDACNAEGIIDTTGLSVPARDPGALAEAITTLLTDTALWQRCSERGPRVARDYDWAVVAARDYEMYRTLVRASAGPPQPTTQVSA